MRYWIKKDWGIVTTTHIFRLQKTPKSHHLFALWIWVKYFLSKSRTLEIILITANFDSYKDIITHTSQFLTILFLCIASENLM